MKFISKLRQGGNSITITIPNEVVEALELKLGDIASFDIETLKKDE